MGEKNFAKNNKNKTQLAISLLYYTYVFEFILFQHIYRFHLACESMINNFLIKRVFYWRDKMDNKIETLSTVKLQYSSDLYKIVDSLNRTLKEQDLMFGLALDDNDEDQAIFTIYRT